MSPTQLALQFVTTRPFVTSNIIGATNLNQLRENLDSVDMAWDKDLEKELEAIHDSILRREQGLSTLALCVVN